MITFVFAVWAVLTLCVVCLFADDDDDLDEDDDDFLDEAEAMALAKRPLDEILGIGQFANKQGELTPEQD